jgi:hypothetical protein
MPLIYSSGPDGATIDPLGDESSYGIDTTPFPTDLGTICYGNGRGTKSNPGTAADNITNHDLISK